MRAVSREWCARRETYADRVYVGERVFAVADGMGIGRGAVVAAQTAIEVVKRSPFPDSVTKIEDIFREVNREVMTATARLGDRQVSGTTLSLLSLTEEHYLMGHVGDSRIYLFRNGDVIRLTEDQVTYLGGKKQVRVLGIEWNPEILTREGDLGDGDVFLLISDGFAEKLSDKMLAEIFSKDIEDFADRLSEAYLRNRGTEDLSFVIISVS